MRLIDADVLKKDLTRFYENEVTAKQLIDEQPTVEPQSWIPCNERLPEEAGMYLITEQNYGFKLDAVCKNVLVHSSYFSVNEKEFQDTVYLPNCSNITAWMPLPEPWRGADE